MAEERYYWSVHTWWGIPVDKGQFIPALVYKWEEIEHNWETWNKRPPMTHFFRLQEDVPPKSNAPWNRWLKQQEEWDTENTSDFGGFLKWGTPSSHHDGKPMVVPDF